MSVGTMHSRVGDRDGCVVVRRSWSMHGFRCSKKRAHVFATSHSCVIWGFRALFRRIRGNWIWLRVGCRSMAAVR